MIDLPADLEPYRTVGPFTSETVPAGLTRSHETKADVWGHIKVSAGSLVLTRYDMGGAIVARETVRAGEATYVAPQEPHAVTLDPDAIFSVSFMRRGEPV